MKSNHVPLKKVLDKKLRDPQFRLYFNESRVISELCLAIAQARYSVGLSQVELAKKTGTTQSVIGRLEGGNNGRMPSLELLGRIAKALGMNLVVAFEKDRAA